MAGSTQSMLYALRLIVWSGKFLLCTSGAVKCLIINTFWTMLFTSQKTGLEMLLFLSDNLAHLPYATLEEPLFVAHHIDMTLSVTGSTLLQSFNEVTFACTELCARGGGILKMHS